MKELMLPSRVAPWGFVKTAGKAVSADKRSAVKYIEFNITGRCQAGCITCPSIRAYPDEKKIKTVQGLRRELERFKSFFTKLKKLGMELITIYGREPTLWDREAPEPNKFLKELIAWLSNDLKVKVCLATSGISLDAGVLKVLFDNQGILFMKDWGSKRSVEKLIKNKQAYSKIRQSWALVKKISKDYKKTRVMAEFLYTGINRKDLQAFWRNCFKNGFLPFVEVPVIKGACVRNYKQLNLRPQTYVRDIYELSLLNLSLRYGLSKGQARQADIWQPPYGSIFPSPCDKLTWGKGLFLERNGNLNFCCGVDKRVGKISDRDIRRKLRASLLIKRARQAYEHLEGFCGACDYSRKLHLCYGCRGNGYTYPGHNRGIFGPDPLCFGKLALTLAQKGKLKFMSKNHIEKILSHFKH
jgi:sulfatase maturation enzyme AslB (radical SAM superfamily)